MISTLICPALVVLRHISGDALTLLEVLQHTSCDAVRDRSTRAGNGTPQLQITISADVRRHPVENELSTTGHGTAQLEQHTSVAIFWVDGRVMRATASISADTPSAAGRPYVVYLDFLLFMFIESQA